MEKAMNRKTFIRLFGLMTIFLTLAGCSGHRGLEQLNLNDDFSEGDDDWEVGFADLPVDYDPALYELNSERRELPNELEGYGIYLQGHNRSDDLFMYLAKQVTGLLPNTTYQITYNIDLATNVPGGMVGIGGSPGESVYVKAGASTHQPMVTAMDEGILRINVDKGNQASDGHDMRTIGDIASPDTDGSQFVIKPLFAEQLQATTNAEGGLWLMVGTDSGFEGMTTLYYARIEAALTNPEEK